MIDIRRVRFVLRQADRLLFMFEFIAANIILLVNQYFLDRAAFCHLLMP